MHPIGPIDDTVEHLINCADNNSGDPASRLIQLLDHPHYEIVVVFKCALTGINGFAFTEATVIPKPRPMLFFLSGRIETLTDEKRRIASEDRLAGYCRQCRDPREETELLGRPFSWRQRLSDSGPLIHSQAIDNNDRQLSKALLAPKPMRHIPRHLVKHDGARQIRQAMQSAVMLHHPFVETLFEQLVRCIKADIVIDREVLRERPT
jgi:hypothetical protein